MNTEIDTTCYDIGERIIICTYRPVPDLHIPLACAEKSEMTLLTWTILPEADGYSTYLLVCWRAQNRGGTDSLTIESTFGPRSLALRRATTPLPETFGRALSNALLLKAARLPSCQFGDALDAIGELPEPPPSDPLATCELSSDGMELRLEGCHSGFHVVARAGAPRERARVAKVGFRGAEALTTCITVDVPVFGTAFWLLGDGRYTALDRRDAAR